MDFLLAWYKSNHQIYHSRNWQVYRSHRPRFKIYLEDVNNQLDVNYIPLLYFVRTQNH